MALVRDFEDLSWRGQVGRLRRMASAGLERFGLRARGPLRCLGHWENATFCAELSRRLPGSAGPHDPRRVLVRVHRPGYQTARTIRSELLWLDALQSEERLAVPLALEAPSGDRVLPVECEGVPEARNVSILRWLPGPILGHGRRQPRLETSRIVGEVTALLHEHARAWKRPRSFHRRRMDAEGVRNDGSGLGPDGEWQRRLSPAVRRRVERGLEVGAEAMAASERETGVLLIHADLHASNVVKHPTRLGVIDFDDCGVGSVSCDFAASLASLRHREDWDAQRAAHVEGYERVRPFDRAWLDHLDGVLIARLSQWMRWAASRAADNPRFAHELPEWSQAVDRRLKQMGV